MPYQPVPDTARVVVRGTTGSAATSWSFSMHFSQPGFDTSGLITLVDRVEDFLDELREPLWDGYHFTNITAYDLRTVDGDKIERAIDLSGGVQFDTPVAVSNALVVSFTTNKRGRWSAGRVFLPVVTEQVADELDIQPAFANTIRDKFQALINNPAAGWTMVVVSRYLEGQKRPQATTAPVLTAVIKNYRFGTQRRRLRRNSA